MDGPIDRVPRDVWGLIFAELPGETDTLARVCHAWRHALPSQRRLEADYPVIGNLKKHLFADLTWEEFEAKLVEERDNASPYGVDKKAHQRCSNWRRREEAAALSGVAALLVLTLGLIVTIGAGIPIWIKGERASKVLFNKIHFGVTGGLLGLTSGLALTLWLVSVRQRVYYFQAPRGLLEEEGFPADANFAIAAKRGILPREVARRAIDAQTLNDRVIALEDGEREAAMKQLRTDLRAGTFDVAVHNNRLAAIGAKYGPLRQQIADIYIRARNNWLYARYAEQNPDKPLPTYQEFAQGWHYRYQVDLTL